MSENFKSAFCGCFSEIAACLFVFCCPMIGVGCIQCHNRNTYQGNGGPVAYLCHCCLGFYGNAFNRMQLRQSFGIKGNYFTDCLVYACCLGLCGSVQEFAETKLRASKPNK